MMYPIQIPDTDVSELGEIFDTRYITVGDPADWPTIRNLFKQVLQV
jgi:hypothetical protein